MSWALIAVVKIVGLSTVLTALPEANETNAGQSELAAPRIVLSQSTESATIRQRPLSLSPTFDVEHSDGSRTTIRQRPVSLSPTYDVDNSDGTTATIRERALSLSPTYDVNRSDGSNSTIRKRPVALSPTWDVNNSDGSRSTIRQRPIGLSPTYDVENSDGSRSTIRQRPIALSPTWDVEHTPSLSRPAPTFVPRSVQTPTFKPFRDFSDRSDLTPRYGAPSNSDTNRGSYTSPTFRSFGNAPSRPSYGVRGYSSGRSTSSSLWDPNN